jgi:SAM-dependent methyltransferase
LHPSSFLKAKLFVETYCPPDRVRRVIEIGSKSYLGHETYKTLFPSPLYEYVGLDIEPGSNVDIVQNGYVWSGLAHSSFDVVISGQTFEHNPFFWVTFCEMARILKPCGHMLVIAPGGGTVHRFPYDCWRFYPDAWMSLCAVTGLTLVESYFEPDDIFGEIDGGKWRDSAVIATKPALTIEAQRIFDARLSELAAPYAAFPFDLGQPMNTTGPCFRLYEIAVRAQAKQASVKRKIKRALRRVTGYSIGPIFRGLES